MRKYASGLLGVVLATALLSFEKSSKIEEPSSTTFAARWFVYNSGEQDEAESYEPYTPTAENPEPPICSASARLCAISVDDANANGQLDQTELNGYFVTHDANPNGSLDDESVSSDLIKKP
ncbi:hypothetical protein ACTJIJ_14830 [Niabella sp. 22666]|uniref:hypothetical protein n=1 Tax=Niabella sp. 22666 TaxID=3453954 RepID=UPI003F82FB04